MKTELCRYTHFNFMGDESGDVCFVDSHYFLESFFHKLKWKCSFKNAFSVCIICAINLILCLSMSI